MALNSQYSILARNAQLNGMTALMNSGTLKIYSGSQPATADTAITSQVLLTSLTLNNPAFSASVSGAATANSIQFAPINTTGTASWFRIITSGSASSICDGTVSTGSANAVFGSIFFQSGAIVQIQSLTLSSSISGS